MKPPHPECVPSMERARRARAKYGTREGCAFGDARMETAVVLLTLREEREDEAMENGGASCA